MLLKKKLMSILFWSVISAAFIGPGTLVTASTAGAQFGFSLSWALGFATIACIVFQEMAARLTLVTGKDLAATLSEFSMKGLIMVLPFGVILGCVAYEAGNMLGASVGLRELLPMSETWALVLIAALASLPLMLSSLRWIATLLGGLVAVMGVAFMYVAINMDISLTNLITNLVVPSIPAQSDWVVLGLIGTTVVPYNLFLGSGISRTGAVGEMRFGLILSVILGGLVSLAILVTGTLMSGQGSLLQLIEVTGLQLGPDMQNLVALGLFAAGFTSAVTAPLAAGLIIRGLYPKSTMIGVRSVSMAVLLTGALSGILHYSPEVIILAAQGLNGLILPLATAILWYITNHSARMGIYVTPLWMNILAFLLMNVLITLGIRNILSSLGRFLEADLSVSPLMLLLLSVPVTGLLAYSVIRIRSEVRP